MSRLPLAVVAWDVSLSSAMSAEVTALLFAQDISLWTVFVIKITSAVNVISILISSGFIWSLGHVSNAATISPGVLAILSAGAGNIWLIVAPSLIMLMDVDRIINVGWSEKGLKIGWQKQYFWCISAGECLNWTFSFNFLKILLQVKSQ